MNKSIKPSFRFKYSILFAIISASCIMLPMLAEEFNLISGEYTILALPVFFIVGLPGFLLFLLLAFFSGGFFWPDSISPLFFGAVVTIPSVFFWAFIGYFIGIKKDTKIIRSYLDKKK